MRHIDLFSGIGGFALAAHWAGLETVLFCEKEPYAQKVLRRHWPHVPIVDDIRELTWEIFNELTYVRDAKKQKEHQVDDHIVSHATRCKLGNGGRGTGGGTASRGGSTPRRKSAKLLSTTAAHVLVAEQTRLSFCASITSATTATRSAESINHKRGNLRSNEGCQTITRFSATTVTTQNNTTANAPTTLVRKPFLLTAGVPCQPASVAGARKGTEDDRWLWPEAIRVTAELKPTWALFENPTGILSLDNGAAFDQILTDLGGIGYDAATFVIPAAAVGAPHRRDRVWIVGYDRSQGELQPEGSESDEWRWDSNAGKSADVGHAERSREDTQPETGRSRRTVSESDWRQPEPRLGREFNGLPAGMDRDRWPAPLGSLQYDWEPPRVTTRKDNRANRLKALGNAIVPQVAYEIIQAIVHASQQGTPRSEVRQA